MASKDRKGTSEAAHFSPHQEVTSAFHQPFLRNLPAAGTSSGHQRKNESLRDPTLHSPLGQDKRKPPPLLHLKLHLRRQEQQHPQRRPRNLNKQELNLQPNQLQKISHAPNQRLIQDEQIHPTQDCSNCQQQQNLTLHSSLQQDYQLTTHPEINFSAAQ